MEKQVDNKGFTWVVKNFSSLKSELIYSDEFDVGGCKWRLLAYPNGFGHHLSLYLQVPDSDSLPIGWRRHAKFSLTLVNQFNLSLRKDERHWFDQNSPDWGVSKMISHTKLQEDGFLMNGDLIIVVKIDLLKVVGKLNESEESLPVIESIDVNGFQVLPSQESYSMSMKKQVNNNGITWVVKNFSSLKSEFIYSDEFDVGGCKWRLQAYPKGYEKADHLSLYLDVPDEHSLPIGWSRHVKFSLILVNQFNLSLRKGGQHWFDENSPDSGFSEMISLTELHAKEGFLMNGDLIIVAKIDLLEVVGKLEVSEESSQVIESIDVNGFQVLPSQVASVEHLFKRHLDIASKFRPKNPYLMTAHMNFLLSLTQTLRQSPQEISNDDISVAEVALVYLGVAGFKLDWLEKKLDELKKKKKKEEASLARLRELEEKLKPLKAQMDEEKAELLAARAPLSFYEDDVV